MAVPDSSFETRSFAVLTPADPLYAMACEFTHGQYLRRLGCELDTYFPTILASLDADSVTAVCGVRPADEGPLFLEQYLDQPVEQLLGEEERKDIVELGGFCATGKLDALLLMRDVASQLSEMGFTTVVCTANQPVRGCLRRLGIRSRLLAKADPDRVEQANHWGSYYRTGPLVLAGDVNEGVNVIQRVTGT